MPKNLEQFLKEKEGEYYKERKYNKYDVHLVSINLWLSQIFRIMSGRNDVSVVDLEGDLVLIAINKSSNTLFIWYGSKKINKLKYCIDGCNDEFIVIMSKILPELQLNGILHYVINKLRILWHKK